MMAWPLTPTAQRRDDRPRGRFEDYFAAVQPFRDPFQGVLPPTTLSGPPAAVSRQHHLQEFHSLERLERVALALISNPKAQSRYCGACVLWLRATRRQAGGRPGAFPTASDLDLDLDLGV